MAGPLTPIRLKNGTEEGRIVVTATMMSLRGLLEDVETGGPIAFYELVMLARDRNHKLFGNTERTLRDRALFPLHGSIRNIILSAVEGDGLDMTLGSPIAEGADA